MLVMGWCTNWAAAAASCKSHCKGSSGWMVSSPNGKPGSSCSVRQNPFRDCVQAFSAVTPLEETGFYSLFSE